MKKIETNKLDEILGGDASYVTGPIINAIVSVVKLIRDAGYDLGSGIRRMIEGEVCPLD